MSGSWADVGQTVEDLVAERPDEYGSEVRAVMADLLALMERLDGARPYIGPGYWPTFVLNFDEPGFENLQLEVFGDRIEVYRFTDQLFDVREEKHVPGEGFSEAFIRDLPTSNA
ncbi:hypothetical protein [Brevundimonas sp. FT23028]|uniref:hypothetical protein n=1 Tax=Brevundimonas sp. FT23028 TaxID=3393748 RepID=UPI003B58A002